MSKILKLLAILILSLCFAVSCSNSVHNSVLNNTDSNEHNNSGGDEESEHDDTGEFVTVGTVSEKYLSCMGYNFSVKADKKNRGIEREFVEPDFYKIDGNILWLINSGNVLSAIDISDYNHPEILDNIKLEGIAGEIYIHNGAAYVFVNDSISYDEGDISYYNRKVTRLIVVSTEDPSELSIIGELEIDGQFSDSRQAGDLIYVATTEHPYVWKDSDGQTGTTGTGQFSITSININDPQNIKIADKASAEGDGERILYVSHKSIYTAGVGNNAVTMFDISDPDGKILKKAEFTTAGFVEHPWQMHETGGSFFVETSSNYRERIIESFDISDPENVKKLDKFTAATECRYCATKFDGNKMYVQNYTQFQIIDLSDPLYLKQIGELETSDWSTQLEVRGSRVFAVKRNGQISGIRMYDVSDPENPTETSSVELGTDMGMFSEDNEISEDWKAFKIFDELGLILIPIFDYEDNSYFRDQPVPLAPLYRLYLVDFDLNEGLKKRGYIESDRETVRGVAVNNLILDIGENNLLLADATDRDHPKITSRIDFIYHTYPISECSDSLCGIDNSKFVAYDETGKIAWKSSRAKVNQNYNGRFHSMINDQSAYFYAYEFCTEKSLPLKIIKFNEDKTFEDTGDFTLAVTLNELDTDAVSNNNFIAMRGWEYVEYNRKSKIIFYDMNITKNGIKSTEFYLDYLLPDYFRDDIFAAGNTFWTSGCKLKNTDQNDKYLCYAIPFDTGSQAKPEQGSAVNIPGELVGVSENSKYLYTKTPGETNTFYILKLNENKTAATVVKKESLHYFVKNDKVFFMTLRGSRENYSGQDSSELTNVTEVKIVSASDGSEIYKKQIKGGSRVYNVRNGGIIIITTENWIYTAPDGTEKVLLKQTCPLSDPLFLDGKIYIVKDNGDFCSFDVK